MSSNIPRNIRPLQTHHRTRRADNFGRVESQHDIDEIINFVRNRQNTNLQLQRESTELGMKKTKAPLPGIGGVSALPGIGETPSDCFDNNDDEHGQRRRSQPGLYDSRLSSQPGFTDSKRLSPDFNEAAYSRTETVERRLSQPGPVDRFEVHVDMATNQSDSGHSNSSWDTDNPDTDAAYESDFDTQDSDFPKDGAKSRSPTPERQCPLTQSGYRLCKSLDGIPVAGSASPQPVRQQGNYKSEPGRRPGVSRSLPPVLPDRPSAPAPTQATRSHPDIMVLPERPSAPSPSVTPPLSEEGTGSQDDPIDYIDSH